MDDFFKVAGYEYSAPVFENEWWPGTRGAQAGRVRPPPITESVAALHQPASGQTNKGTEGMENGTPVAKTEIVENDAPIKYEHLLIIIFVLVCVIVYLTIRVNRIEDMMMRSNWRGSGIY